MRHAIQFWASKRNRRILSRKYTGMPKNLPQFISLRYDPARPMQFPVTIDYLRQLAVSGFIGLERIPRECVQREARM